jgi:hypothetical protein
MSTPNKLAGNWRAIVTDNQDPVKSGRVKISIESLGLNNMWAEPAIQIGGSAIHGSYAIPRIGDKIFVFFDGNNINHPIYFATSPCQTDIPAAFNGGSDILINTRNAQALDTGAWKEPTVSATSVYPLNQGIKFPGGVLLVVDESGGQSKVAMYHPSNSYEEFLGSGTHVVRIASNDFEIIMGNKFIYIGGSVSEIVGGSVGTSIGRDNVLTVGGDDIENVLGKKTLVVAGKYAITDGDLIDIITKTLKLLWAGGSVTCHESGVTLEVGDFELQADKIDITAPEVTFDVDKKFTVKTPLTIDLKAMQVKLGILGSFPFNVHVGTLSYDGYINNPIKGGSTTIMGSP